MKCQGEFKAVASWARFCPPCRIANDKQKRKEAYQRWFAKPESKKKNREKVREWREADPERTKKSHLDSYYRRWFALWAHRNSPEEKKRRRAYGHAYRRAHLAQDCAKAKRRYAMKRGAVGRHTVEEFLKVCADQAYKCKYCMCPLLLQTVTEDHVVPVSRGGTDYIDNIVASCHLCNSRKKAKPAEEYMRILCGGAPCRN
jgi:5-methylcytosine-specific restriction endonuclease McrA